MAARRLVLVLLALLVVSTFAATLVPPPDDGGEESSTTTTATGAAAAEAKHDHIKTTISVDAKRAARVDLVAGDELTLRVTSKDPHEVEIPLLGEYDEVDRYAPLTFDLLVDEAGTYPVRLVGSGRVLARIEVSECCRTSRKSAGTSRSR